MEMVYFLNIIQEFQRIGLSDSAIARELGITRQRLHNMLGKGKGRAPIQRVSDEVLYSLLIACKKHKIEPRNWAKLGRLIDKEFAIKPKQKDK
jgi:transposase